MALIRNTTPYAGSLTYNIYHDRTLSVDPMFGVLSYAFDYDGDPLTIHAIDGVHSAVGDWVATTLGGLIKVEADASFEYQPPTGITGTDSVEFTVTDGIAFTTATAYINVTNTAPNATMAQYNTLVNTVLIADPLLLDFGSDYEHDALRVIRINGQLFVAGTITLTTTNDGVITVTITDGIAETTDYLYIHVTTS